LLDEASDRRLGECSFGESFQELVCFLEICCFCHQLFFNILSSEDVLEIDPFPLAVHQLLHYFLSQNDFIVELVGPISQLSNIPVG